MDKYLKLFRRSMILMSWHVRLGPLFHQVSGHVCWHVDGTDNEGIAGQVKEPPSGGEEGKEGRKNEGTTKAEG